MPQQVRFTPEEIRALMASGELPMDLIRKMHPDDQKVAQAIFNSHDYSQTDGHPASVPEQLAHIGSQVKNHPLAAAGMGAALAVPLATTGALGMGASAIAGELPMMAKVAGYTGLAALGSKLGIPASAMEAVALYMGMKGGMGKMTGSAAPAEAMTVEQELANKGINSANVGRSTLFKLAARRDTDPCNLEPEAPFASSASSCYSWWSRQRGTGRREENLWTSRLRGGDFRCSSACLFPECQHRCICR
jgi:hypothetical protein